MDITLRLALRLAIRVTMANRPSAFSHGLHVYKKRTRNDLLSHALAFRLRTCESPRAVISVLQEQVRGIDRSGSGDKSWTLLLSPTVNVLVAISASVQEGVGLVIIGASPFRSSCP